MAKHWCVCVIAVVLLASAPRASAEDPAGPDQPSDTSQEGDLELLNMMLTHKAFLRAGGRERIRELAAQVPERRRVGLYHSFREDKAAIGLALNVVLPGVGSLVQYDYAGAAVGGLMVLGGYAVAMFGVLTYGFGGASGGESVAIGGYAAAVAGYVFLLARPFWWSSIWNDRLADSLLLSPRSPRGGIAAPGGEAAARDRFGSIQVVLLRIAY